MARGKVQLRRIEKPVDRQVTFCKRRGGLLKKARELSVLCETEIGIIIFSAQGKLYEQATNGTMEYLIRRYRNTCGDSQVANGEASLPQEMQQEILLLTQERDDLQKCLRYMFGEGSLGQMTLDELQALERHLEIWIYNIRSAKMQIMFQEIESLKNMEGMLKTTNEILEGKVQFVEQNGLPNARPTIGDLRYPVLTIQNGMFNW